MAWAPQTRPWGRSHLSQRRVLPSGIMLWSSTAPQAGDTSYSKIKLRRGLIVRDLHIPSRGYRQKLIRKYSIHQHSRSWPSARCARTQRRSLNASESLPTPSSKRKGMAGYVLQHHPQHGIVYCARRRLHQRKAPVQSLAGNERCQTVFGTQRA